MIKKNAEIISVTSELIECCNTILRRVSRGYGAEADYENTIECIRIYAGELKQALREAKLISEIS